MFTDEDFDPAMSVYDAVRPEMPPPPIPPPEPIPGVGGGDGEPPAPIVARAPSEAPKVEPFSEYALLRKALGEQASQPKDNYSWLARGGEGINAAFMRRRPDQSLADEMDAKTAAERAAPMQRFGQGVALAKAKQADADRAPLPEVYADGFGAPKGVNKEQLATWLDLRAKSALADKNARGPSTVPLEIAREKNASNERIKAKEIQLRTITQAWAQAQGEEKIRLAKDALQLKRDIEEIRAALAREGMDVKVDIADKTLDAANARDERRREDREDAEARKSIPPELSDTLTALDEFASIGPQALADVKWWERLARAVPGGLGEPFIDTKSLATMSKEATFQAFQNRMESGLAMTDSERSDARARFGLRVLSDPTLFGEMIRFYKAIGEKRKAQKQAGLTQRALGKFGAAGGYVSQEAMKGAPDAAPNTEGLDTSIGETRLPKAEAPPGHTILINPKGQPRAVPDANVEKALATPGWRRSDG